MWNRVKADGQHRRNYPHTPTDYRLTDKHPRLVRALLCSMLKVRATDRKDSTKYIFSLLRGATLWIIAHTFLITSGSIESLP